MLIQTFKEKELRENIVALRLEFQQETRKLRSIIDDVGRDCRMMAAELQMDIASLREEHKFLNRKIEIIERSLGGGLPEYRAVEISARIDALESHVNEFIKSRECKWDGIDG